MKKTLFVVLFMIFSMSASFVLAGKSVSDKSAIPVKKENKMTEEEMSRMINRVEEIRNMDKTNLSVIQKRELKNELKTMKERVRRGGGVIYISAGALIIIIILLIILL